MKFAVELTPEQLATLERLQVAGVPAATLADKVRHLLEVAIGDQQNIQEMQDSPPPSLYEAHPF
ncbi:hypothetical protein [Aureimonas psammosilenae]|uniref:hypothetical protein n=1 Tax=Aureimonas psammosilenae TaxID=2495496 RepID=UPI0012611069|nr:hypothetical protein [Aureimonas psammosilenae]